MDFVTKYPNYIIRKGTHLYRKAKTRKCYPNMFFGFCPAAAESALLNKHRIQIWEVVTEIESPVFIRGVTNIGLGITGIVDVYNFYFPDNPVNDWQCVDIKRKSWPQRMNLLNNLRKKNVNRWIAPLEDLSHAMELFLFESRQANSHLVKFVGYLTQKAERNTEDSFDSNYIKKLKLSTAQFNFHNPDDSLVQYILHTTNTSPLTW